jgi:hypothetical protein
VADPVTPHRRIARSPGRTEITAALGGAFGRGAVHRDQLLGVARAHGARREVLVLLERLPAYRYATLGQVLDHLPGGRRAR